MTKKNKTVSIVLVVALLTLIALLIPKFVNACSLWCCDENLCNLLLADCWGDDTCYEEGIEPTSYGECLARCYCPSQGGYKWLVCNPWYK